MVLCGLFSALLAICAWICIPVLHITYTLQTFAIFLALFTLGGKWGTLTIGIYLLLGAVGVPVFSGFRGGFGALLGVTGGFLWGFLLSGILYWMLKDYVNHWALLWDSLPAMPAAAPGTGFMPGMWA